PEHEFLRPCTTLNKRAASVKSAKRNAEQANSLQFACTTRSCQRTDTTAPEHVLLRQCTTLNKRVASVKSAKRNAEQANSLQFPCSCQRTDTTAPEHVVLNAPLSTSELRV